MYTWYMWNYLKFCEIHIQCTIKPQRSCNGGHNLTNQAIEIGVRGTLDIKITGLALRDGPLETVLLPPFKIAMCSLEKAPDLVFLFQFFFLNLFLM